MAIMSPDGRGPRARTIAHRRVYEGRIVTLDVDEVEEPGGVRGIREVVRHAGSVAALPVHDDGRVVLVRQYRYPVDREVWELPAGKLDGGESPEEGARRELEEEVGRRAGRLVPLASILTTPGFTDEMIHLFAAFELSPVPQRLEHDEVIEVVPTPLGQALAMIWSGELNDAKSALALLHAARRLGRL